MTKRIGTAGLALLLFAGLSGGFGVDQATAQLPPEAAQALKKPIAIERDEPVATIIYRPHMGKILIDARLNGVEREFLFDTGSPTVISRELARELDLKIIGSNTGRDANGREFTTEIAILDRLDLGGVAFRSVPVLVADFSATDPDRCFMDAGLIGSEIFAGSAWHLDPERSEIRIAARAKDLGSKAPVIEARLHDWGYPHAPVFSYGLGDFEDRGLFDTGNSGTIVLFDRLLSDKRVKRAITPGSMRKGRGSHGVSAAGLGDMTDLFRFELEGLRLGDSELGAYPASTRAAPPSLIGLGILDTHSVTLDYPQARLLLHPRRAPNPRAKSTGFGVMAIEDGVRVMQLYKGSRAQKAGLQLGDQVVAIDGRELPHGADAKISCETKRWLVEARPAASAKQITVLREGKRVVIALDG